MIHVIVGVLLVSTWQVTRSTTVPNSCNGLSDGNYWMKFLDGDDYSTVYTKCSNEYAIIDLSRDANFADYFSSLDKYVQESPLSV